MSKIKIRIIAGILIGLFMTLASIALIFVNKQDNNVSGYTDFSNESNKEDIGIIDSGNSIDVDDIGDVDTPSVAVIASGVVGDITWNIYEDGVYRLSGDGEFTGDSNLVKSYINRITSIDVSDGIVSIGDKAFSGLTNVKHVELPFTLKRIGSSAFYHIKSLTSIELPDGIETIGEAAFAYCEYLESVKLPESLIGISKDVFRGCIHLKLVTIPKRVEVIEYRAFYDCKELEKVSFSGGGELRSIDQEAFGNCESLSSVDLPLMTDLGTGIFMGCIRLESVILPDNMTSIPANMFDGCRSLKEVYWPIALSEIGDSAFLACESLMAIEFPNALKKIGKHAFSGCNSLDSLSLNEGLLYIGDYAFSNCGLLEITLPSTLDFVGYQAFKQNKNLTKVTILPVRFKMDGDHPNNFESTLFQDCPVRVVFKYRDLVIPTVMFSMNVRDNYQYLD